MTVEGPVIQHGNILLGSRTGANTGHVQLTTQGIKWKRSGGGREEVVAADSIDSVAWVKVSRGYQLSVRRNNSKPPINLLGFKSVDKEGITEFLKEHLNLEVEEKQLSTKGHNWGELDVHGSSLVFSVDGDNVLDLPLPEATAAQAGKDDVMLTFHMDDTTQQDREDALVEVTFHIPDGNTTFKDDNEEDLEPEDRVTGSKAFYDRILALTDSGALATDDLVLTFDDVGIEVPRGRFTAELHLSMMRLLGQTQDFKVRHSSIHRLLVLPRPGTPHTNVIINLDPPIRKGQTFYPSVICRFDSKDQVDCVLEAPEELLQKKNKENNGRLAKEMSGPMSEVFAQVIRGLYGAKITRPSKQFKSAEQEPAIRCAYKADDGFIYPLERAFYYGHKPPLLIPHDEIVSVEFLRQGGVQTISARTFDLLFRLRNDTEYQFRNITRQEWTNILNFLQLKDIKIENLNQARAGPTGVSYPAMDQELDDIDPGRAAMYARAVEEEDEDDEDFDEGQASEDSTSDSDDEDDEDDAEIVPEGNIQSDMTTKEKKKRQKDAEGEPSSKKQKQDGEPKKRGRKPRDKDAPKQALNAYQCYVREKREQVKAENPNATPTEIMKLCAEGWKAVDASGRGQYAEFAATDKLRFERENQEYLAKKQQQASQEEAGEGGQGQGEQMEADD